ncbi:MAG: holo-ACP synthase [Leptospiraceae bacterium]|nr:holo-ACP synthase [Leptospiraceae bacterium]
MKISVGNDLVENFRIEETFERFKEKFLEKVFTKGEIDYCMGKKNPIPYLSARFAVKEAFIKAVDLPNGKALDMREIELFGDFFGKKNLKLTGKAEEIFKEQGYRKISVSITHTENYASAVVIIYGEEK